VTVLSAAQVAGLVRNAGFPASVQATMVAICRAESGYNVGARNPSGALGLFQILWPVHKKYSSSRLLTDAQYNTNAAHDIYLSQGLGAWVTFTNGVYKRYLSEARSAVAHASSVTGSSVTSTDSSSANGTGQPSITYGPPGPQYTEAGIGTPLTSAAETDSPLSGLRILGSELGGDYSTVVTGTPTYTAAMETIPNLTFTISDPDGKLLWSNRNVWVAGSHVTYQDLSLRIDTIAFQPGDVGTGELVITCVDDIIYRLQHLTGARTVSNQSASEWIAQELRIVDIDPNQWLLAEAVPTQSQISRDVPDQTGTASSGDAPSAWTTIVRLASELGKRVFISGRRLVFGSSAFAMQWTAPGPVRLSWDELDWPERFMSLPTVTHESVSNNANVVECKGKIPLSRAKYFRPGVPVIARNVPALAANTWVNLMCFDVSFTLGTDTDGADITLVAPVNPPPQPPSGPTSAGTNAGSTSNGASVSGGGVDGQVAQFVALALKQAGKRYVFGAYASPNNANPTAFDCSELVQWCCERVGIGGCPRTSTEQREWVISHKDGTSIATGIKQKGALLFANGHVAISLGNGRTIEAMDARDGVRQGNANGRPWIAAGFIPGAKGY
jgi:cell wall-associated NlpC family hydrolase